VDLVFKYWSVEFKWEGVCSNLFGMIQIYLYNEMPIYREKC